MRLLGFDIRVTKAAVGLTRVPPMMNALTTGGWWPYVRESFAGAWQRNIEVETTENVLKFSAVYACVSLIADDISKLRLKLVEDGGDDIWTEISNPAYSPVLRKPNRYQTRIQFINQWITCKLLYGNTYVVKARDQRGVVIALYILDPRRVTPLVAPDGGVFYRLNTDQLAQITDVDVIVPATEIIHDRMLTLWHPLIGVSPIYACGSSATQGLRIQANSNNFFANMSRPSGILTSPLELSQDYADTLKAEWNREFGEGRVGKVAVLGGGFKYEAMAIPAEDAQLIEQLRWTVEDVARCFHVPLHKLGMGQPTLNNIVALNQDYYTQTLQALIESLELLLDEGLALPSTLGIELDLDGLLRMDPLSLADATEKGVRAGIVAPNEARFKMNLAPVIGGDTPYMQQQNYSLAALNERPPPTSTLALPAPTEAPAPKPNADDDAARELAAALIRRFNQEAVNGG